MGILKKSLGTLAVLLLGASACAEQWFTVITPSSIATTLVEIDLDTVRIQSQRGEGVIRLTYDVLQPHPAGFGYRSFVAIAQFDCGRRSISLAGAAYYPLPRGDGQRQGAESAGTQAGMPPHLIDGIPAPIAQALLKASCGIAPN